MSEWVGHRRGDYMVVSTPGWPAKGIRVVTRSRVNHAVLLTEDGPTDGRWTVIEEGPTGAIEVPLSNYQGMSQFWSCMPLSDAQRDEVVAAARKRLGTPYSWVDDACIAIADIFGVHVPKWVRDRLASGEHLMCSQYVDTSFLDIGIHLFKDNRLPGDVSPGNLYDIIGKWPL